MGRFEPRQIDDHGPKAHEPAILASLDRHGLADGLPQRRAVFGDAGRLVGPDPQHRAGRPVPGVPERPGHRAGGGAVPGRRELGRDLVRRPCLSPAGQGAPGRPRDPDAAGAGRDLPTGRRGPAVADLRERRAAGRHDDRGRAAGLQRPGGQGFRRDPESRLAALGAATFQADHRDHSEELSDDPPRAGSRAAAEGRRSPGGRGGRPGLCGPAAHDQVDQEDHGRPALESRDRSQDLTAGRGDEPDLRPTWRPGPRSS